MKGRAGGGRLPPECPPPPTGAAQAPPRIHVAAARGGRRPQYSTPAAYGRGDGAAGFGWTNDCRIISLSSWSMMWQCQT
jgi:hypothetical protein